MNNDDLKLKRILDFHDQLNLMLTVREPQNWPSANWIYEKLTEAIYPEVKAIKEEMREEIGENLLD